MSEAGPLRPYRTLRRFLAEAAGRVRALCAAGPAGTATVVGTLLFAAVLHLLWFLLFANSGGDLAAQDAWAEFVGRYPRSAYNLAWYGGMHPVSYSVLSPYLMAVIGVRATMIVAGTLSAGLLALLLVRSPLRRPLPVALFGAFALTCNAVSGRVTFGLGILFALGAVTAIWAWPPRWRHRRWARVVTAAVLSGLATAGSPVAGLFLMVVAAGLLLQGRWRVTVALALPPPVVVATSALLFPFHGEQPMPLSSLAFPVLCSAAVWVLAPREWRTARLGAAVYGLGVIATWAIPSQVGSNVERLALIFGNVVLLALLTERVVAPAAGRPWWHARRYTALLLVFTTVLGWQLFKPVWDVVRTTPDAAWARELAPLVDRLQRVDAERGRVEVVPVRSHREASALVPYVNLARGWNRQADTERNPLFYDEDVPLTADSYRRWLDRWAVRYVVLPSDDPDGAGEAEAELVRGGLPYLEEVWSDANWRLYRVVDPVPMADPPAEVVRAAAEGVEVSVPEPGEVRVRIPWSPWLGLVDEEGKPVEPPEEGEPNAAGCLRAAEPVTEGRQDGGNVGDGEEDPPADEWTVLEAPAPGTYRIAAPYRLPRGTPCPAPEERGAD
ncbi:MFS transporter [Streptomyces carminius]|uniref:MFS transporter n=1 Tax=Streptomyces carminius TaxID=2665496 RepID=UPI0038CD409C